MFVGYILQRINYSILCPLSFSQYMTYYIIGSSTSLLNVKDLRNFILLLTPNGKYALAPI